METRILTFLKENKDSFVSGEEISRALGVSRTAIWKHIQNLKVNGYDIMAQPHSGYRLVAVPDRMLSDEITYGLNTRVFGRSVLSYAAVDSTNDVAFSLAEQNAPEGTLVVAEQQNRGKGRMGRSWISPEGGIYASLILRPRIIPAEAGITTLMAAVGICRTIRTYGPLVCIKWPNDILIDGRKICGILTEMSADMDQVRFIILGFGINVTTPVSQLPENAASLGMAGESVSRVKLLQTVLHEIEQEYQCVQEQKFAWIADHWREYSYTIGRRVCVEWRGRQIEGQAIDIDAQGALMVRDDSGTMHHILSGDITAI